MGNIVRAARRLAGLSAFALVCFAALLYGLGKFDFVFIKRDLPISVRGNAVIELPELSDEDKELRDQVSHMGIGENLSGITSGGEKKDDETAEDQGDSQAQTPALSEYYPSLDQVLASGYIISTDEYISDGDHVLAELILDLVMTRDQIKGEKTVKVDAPVIYEEGGEYFYSVGEDKDYRFSFETYMGYVLVSDKSTVTVYTSEGRMIGTYGHSELTPAYARDAVGNPLFINIDGIYFYLDESGRLLYSSYRDSIHSIGLYFDYGRDFGVSDNPLGVYSRNEDVYFIDEIDTSDFYIRGSIDPDLAYSIYIMRPDYAEKVARYNPRFALALSEVKEQIEEEKRLEEERKNEQLTSAQETLEIPESDTLPIDSEALPAESIENATETEAFTSELITEAPESDTEIVTDKDIESETDTEAETGSASETDTEIPEETEKAPVTSLDPNILIIERTLNLVRYGYGYADDDRSTLDYKYAKAYAFSEGRAAVVDDDGILRYINPMGEVVIDGTGTRMVTSSRYITTEYAEPIYRNSENSKGYLYFDNGLVRVRKLERDYTYRNLIYSDSDVLLYGDGSEFVIPHGYTLVAYSEGILVLKGQNGKFGYYHKDGYWIAQPVYTEIRPFSEGLGVIGFEGGKKGVIDKSGNIVIPFAYEYITAPSCGVMTLYNYETGWKIIVKTSK